MAPILKPLARIGLCIVTVVALTAGLSVVHIHDRVLVGTLGLLISVILTASVGWGIRYAVFLSFLAALAFSWLIQPLERFHLQDERVLAVLAVCLVAAFTASHLSNRVRNLIRAARQRERELRDVINAIPASVWSASADGAVDFTNRRWQEFLGAPPEDAMGWNWQGAVHPDDRNKFLTDWRAALKNGQPMESEARVRQKDGEYRWLFIRNVPVRDEAGNVRKWYGTAIDIDDRKRASDTLRQIEAILSQAQRIAQIGVWVTRSPMIPSIGPPPPLRYLELIRPADLRRTCKSSWPTYIPMIVNVCCARLTFWRRAAYLSASTALSARMERSGSFARWARRSTRPMLFSGLSVLGWTLPSKKS